MDEQSPIINTGIRENVIVEYDGRIWQVSLINRDTNVTNSKALNVVTLSFNNKGNLLINGKRADNDVFLSSSYRNVLSRYEHFKSDFKRKAKANLKMATSGKALSPYSKNMFEVNQKMLQAGNRLKQMKVSSFVRVVSAIRKLSPSELHIPSRETIKKFETLPSFQLKKGEVIEFLGGITQRLKPTGLPIVEM